MTKDPIATRETELPHCRVILCITLVWNVAKNMIQEKHMIYNLTIHNKNTSTLTTNIVYKSINIKF